MANDRFTDTARNAKDLASAQTLSAYGVSPNSFEQPIVGQSPEHLLTGLRPAACSRERSFIVGSRSRLFLLLIIVCLMFGCATRKPLLPPPETSIPTLNTPEEALELLRRTYGQFDSLKASGRLDLMLPNEVRARPASFVVMLERPDRLRLRAYRPLTSTVLELISDGWRCWLYLPAEKTAYLDEGCNSFYAGENSSALSPRMLISAIAVVADYERLRSQSLRGYEVDGIFRLVALEDEQTRRELWIDLSTGLVQRQFLIGRDGAEEVEITYEEHAAQGDVIVPVATNIALPKTGTGLSLTIHDFQSNVDAPETAFTFTPSEKVRIIPSRTPADNFPDKSRESGASPN